MTHSAPATPEDAALESVLGLMRPEIRALVPYDSARGKTGTSDGLLFLDANEAPWPPPAGKTWNRYPDPQPAALAASLAALWGVTPEQLVVTPGSDIAIDLAIRVFCRAGQDQILILPPAFGIYALWAKIQGAGIVEVPFAGEDLPSARILQAVESGSVRLVFLTTPNNPTGTSLPQAPLRALIQALAGRAMVVVDEAYLEFSDQPSVADMLPEAPHLIVLRTLSKGWGLAGIRCGGALAHPQVIRRLRAVQQPYPISRPVTEAALATLTPPGRLLMAERRRILLAERARMQAALARLPGLVRIHPSDANFLLLEMETPEQAAAIDQRLNAAGIIIRRYGGALLARAWRVTLGTPEENSLVLAALGLEPLPAGPAPRRAEILRETRETRIAVILDLDQTAPVRHQTGIGFYDHMLDQLAAHGGFASQVVCEGDLHIDGHHSIEDVALAYGAALRQALGDKRGIQRFGFTAVMDESRAEASLDLSGRPAFVWSGQFPTEAVGAFAAEMTPHVFRSLADSLGAGLHLSVTGENTHHMIEACFKAVGRALRMAIRREGSDLPSTKGVL